MVFQERKNRKWQWKTQLLFLFFIIVLVSICTKEYLSPFHQLDNEELFFILLIYSYNFLDIQPLWSCQSKRSCYHKLGSTTNSTLETSSARKTFHCWNLYHNIQRNGYFRCLNIRLAMRLRDFPTSFSYYSIQLDRIIKGTNYLQETKSIGFTVWLQPRLLVVRIRSTNLCIQWNQCKKIHTI